MKTEYPNRHTTILKADFDREAAYFEHIPDNPDAIGCVGQVPLNISYSDSLNDGITSPKYFDSYIDLSDFSGLEFSTESDIIPIEEVPSEYLQMIAEYISSNAH